MFRCDKNIPNFKLETDKTQCDIKYNNNFKCKIPLQSGYYGLKSPDGYNLTNKEINCKINNNFELVNCDNTVLEIEQKPNPKDYIDKECNLGRYTVPFYLFVFNTQVNCINTFINMEKDNKIINSLFTFIEDPDIKLKMVMDITAKGTLVNKYIFINKFKFLMDILYFDYDDKVADYTDYDYEQNDLSRIDTKNLITKFSTKGLQKINFVTNKSNKSNKSNDTKRDAIDREYRKFYYIINHIQTKLKEIFNDTETKLKEIFNDTETKLKEIFNDTETKYNLINLTNLNNFQTDIIESKDLNKSLYGYKNDISKINEYISKEVISIYNLIMYIQDELKTLKDNTSIPFSLYIFLTYYYQRVFIRKSIDKKDFYSFPLSTKACLNELVLVPSNNQLIQTNKIDIQKYFFPPFPPIFKYSFLKLDNGDTYGDTYPDCVETALFNLVKLFYWNVDRYNFPSGEGEQTLFLQLFKNSIGTQNEEKEYRNKIKSFFWNKEKYGIEYTERRQNYEIKSKLENVLRMIYYLLTIKNIEEFEVQYSQINNISNDELLEQINEQIKKIGNKNIDGIEINNELSYPVLKLTTKNGIIETKIMNGHSEINKIQDIDIDVLNHLYNNIFLSNIKNILFYINIDFFIYIVTMSFEVLNNIIRYVSPYIINSPDRNKKTPLFIAFEKNNTDLVKLLLENGASDVINFPDNLGYTPLYLACGRASVDMVKLLLENGAYPSIKIKTNDNRNILFSALSNLDVFKLLLGIFLIDSINNKLNDQLNDQCQDNIDIVQLLRLDVNQIIELFDYEELELSPLFTNICVKNKVFLKSLLTNIKIEAIDNIDNDGWTLLMKSIQSSPKNIINLILKYSNHNYINDITIIKLKPNALWWGCRRNIFDVVKLLLEKGAKPYINIVNSDGISPLRLACGSNNFDMVKILLENGADITPDVENFIISSTSNTSNDIIRIISEYKLKKKEMNKYWLQKANKYKSKYINLKKLLGK